MELLVDAAAMAVQLLKVMLKLMRRISNYKDIELYKDIEQKITFWNFMSYIVFDEVA